MSYPWRARGPVFMETQKQVPPACPQFTATKSALSRRRLYPGSTLGPPRNTLSCTATAASSHARMPMNAVGGTPCGVSCTVTASPVLDALQSVSTGGKRYFFHECGPTT